MTKPQVHRSKHRALIVLVAASCWGVLGVACVAPSPRLGDYLGPSSPETNRRSLERAPRPLDVGLLLLNDTQGPGAAPALSQEGVIYLAEWGRKALEQVVDLRVVKILDSAQIRPTQEGGQFIRLAQEHGLGHLLVVVQSGVESEAPALLSVGGPESIAVSGYEVKNSSLSEFALLDGKTGVTVLEVRGRGWATMEALTVPLRSNQYPVVRRSIHSAPIFPNEANPRDTLRAVAAADAFEQALMHLQQAWPKPRPMTDPN